MLKSAIEKIQELCKPHILDKDGHTFLVNADGYEEIIPTVDVPETLKLNSLEALVMMVKTEAIPDGVAGEGPLYITVPTHDKVICFGHPFPEINERRITSYVANATDIPGWGGKVSMSFEEAMIALRTRFQPTPDSEYALKLLSDITTGSKLTMSDNGIATSVVTRSGVALQANTPIRPIISLRPYRTFQEVEQPVSQFLIRVSERAITFIEADGGMWKLTARKTIKDYLTKALATEIEDFAVQVEL